MDYLCATHHVWERLDEWIVGLCPWCCLPSPCPNGHERGEGFDSELDEVRESEWRARQERNRHKTGGVRRADSVVGEDTLEIDYLDWS